MYVTHEQGQTREDLALILQEENSHADTAKIGGEGYLETYCMGRYHYYMDDKKESAMWWKD